MENGRAVVYGSPGYYGWLGEDAPEQHNCDQMGCGMIHVLWRGKIDGASEKTGETTAAILSCPTCGEEWHWPTRPAEKAGGLAACPWQNGDTWHCRCGAANTAETCSNCKRARADEWGDVPAEKAGGEQP